MKRRMTVEEALKHIDNTVNDSFIIKALEKFNLYPDWTMQFNIKISPESNRNTIRLAIELTQKIENLPNISKRDNMTNGVFKEAVKPIHKINNFNNQVMRDFQLAA